ncbi:hypothetical protein [Intestinibacter sp.]
MDQSRLDIKLSEINKNYLLEHKYKYCLIYYLNDLVFGDIDKIDKIEEDILVEAFFFNSEKELHIFENNDFEDEGQRFKLVETKDDGSGFKEEFVLKKRIGNKLNKNKYTKLIVNHYLEYEDDGQAYIKYTSLKGVE